MSIVQVAEAEMPTIKYRVDLTNEERLQLQELTHKGISGARSQTRARILLKADEGLHDDEVARALDVGINTVARVRQRFVEGGLQRALKDAPRPGAAPKLDARQCAHVIALACSDAPCGRTRWTLRLLADKVVELGMSESFSREAVRRVLKKTT